MLTITMEMQTLTKPNLLIRMKKMFKGFWLLSDLDGTLIPTPHKAHGQYMPLRTSVCFEPLKRWLDNGGNLCVVTTADRRVFDQVYFSLKPHLKSLREPPSQSGELLLSLYTGASLYRCGKETLEYVEDYHDPALPKGTDTCMCSETSHLLKELVMDIFLDMASDVIHQRAPLTPGWEQHMSRRYQSMWRSFIRYLDKRYSERERYCKDLTMPRKIEYDARWGHLDALIFEGKKEDWKEAYLRSKRQLLVKVGIVRLEALKSSEELQELVWLKTGDHTPVNGCPSPCGESLAKAKPAFNDPLVGRPVGSSISSGTSQVGDSPETRCAQLIVVGVPLRYYSHYFEGSAAKFAALGVHPIAQPNSVVFSKMHVGKGTTVNYLDNSMRSGRDIHSREENRHVKKSFRGMVDLSKAVALGDNPNTADRDLALIPKLQFVSVEIAKQRDARHAVIDASPPNSIVIASPKRGGGLTWAPIDERRMPNICYTGDEEDGCARFLTSLMDRLEASGGAACQSSQTFLRTVAAAAEDARVFKSEAPCLPKAKL